jgi:hypothetical protein
MRLTAVAIVAGLAVPFSGEALHAQGATASLAPSAVELTATARFHPLSQPLFSSEETHRLALVSARPSRRQGEILMIVGAAVLVTGLLVDEAIVSIAGVAIGGYGLYVYLNAGSRRR